MAEIISCLLLVVVCWISCFELIFAYAEMLFHVVNFSTEDVVLQEKETRRINCSRAESIYIHNITFNQYDSLCPQPDSCEDEIQRLKDTCDGKQSCEIATENYFSCPLKPLKVDVRYQCLTDKIYTKDVCGSLTNIHCSEGRKISQISIKHAYVPGPSRTKCIEGFLDKHCSSHQNKCSNELSQSRDTCFFLNFTIKFAYRCIKQEMTDLENTLNFDATTELLLQATTTPDSGNGPHFGIILGAVIGTVLLSLFSIAIFCVRNRRNHSRPNVYLNTVATETRSVYDTSWLHTTVDSVENRNNPQNQNYFVLERENELQYMSITEDIYDVSNNRRHNAVNIYDRTTSGVYDVSDLGRQHRVDDKNVYAESHF